MKKKIEFCGVKGTLIIQPQWFINLKGFLMPWRYKKFKLEGKTGLIKK